MSNVKVYIKTKSELNSLKLTELRSLCKSYEFSNYSGLSKEETINSLLDFFSKIDKYEGFEIANEVEASAVVKFHRAPKIGSFNVMTLRKK